MAALVGHILFGSVMAKRPPRLSKRPAGEDRRVLVCGFDSGTRWIRFDDVQSAGTNWQEINSGPAGVRFATETSCALPIVMIRKARDVAHVMPARIRRVRLCGQPSKRAAIEITRGRKDYCGVSCSGGV